jgi:serine/threonine-protein kinase
MLERDYGPYRLIRRLGRGGMADVYLATDGRTGALVALKLVEQRPDRDSQEICDAERRGAILQDQFGRVDEHVPRVHAFGASDGHFYIDMEYVDGEDLAERIGRGPLPADTATWIAAEVCEFLDRAHRFEATVDDTKVRGIIHADIKPKNVRLNQAGQVKVLDFGIAKGLALSRKLTRNDFGSLAYLSPERLDTGEVDVQVDCWSVGVLLYEMLASRPPFDADSTPHLEALIRRREPPPPLPDPCPPPLQRIVLKLLAGDARRRYESAADIRSDLERFRAGATTRADSEWLGDDAAATRRTVPEPDGGEPGERTHRALAAPATRVEVDDQATRRTTTPPAGGAPPEAGGLATPPPRPPRHSRARRWAAVAALLAGIGLVGNEVLVSSDAKQLRLDLATSAGPAMQGLWTRYQELAHRSLLGLALVGVRGPLKERLTAQAERVVTDYRQDEPAVREAQWRDAAAWLTNVLHLDPGDTRAASRLNYCDAQLQRITGEARKRKHQPSGPPFHEAIARFEEAARLDPSWPDPYLGLARVYVYGIEDLDKAIAALREAESRGYRPGNRELVQLADGYRSRADRVRREAAAVRGLGQEKECLQKAADDYRQALDLYGKAIGVGEVSTTMRQVRARLDDVHRRLAELSPTT